MNADERRCIERSSSALIRVHPRFLPVLLCALGALGVLSGSFCSAAAAAAAAATAAAAAAAADVEQFAAEEFGRYTRAVTGDDRLAGRVAFAVEPADGGDGGDGGESFAVRPEADGRLRVTGSNANMLLAGTYFLLDQLGCRFLAPQFDHYRGAAEVVPRNPSLALPKLDHPIVRRPQLKYRKLYVEEGISHDAANLKQLVEWMPKVGYNVLVVPTDYGNRGRVKWDHWRDALTPELERRGITIEVGGHGYENFLNADMPAELDPQQTGARQRPGPGPGPGRGPSSLFEQHPDWFGKDEQGVPQKNKRVVFCTSNADAVAHVTKNVLAYLKDRPEIDIFDFWPPDGARWCACDACEKLGEPPDRQAILLKQVRAKLKPVRPDVRLEVIAYSSYLEPPKRVPVDENVLVDFCPISQHFDAPIDDPANKNKTYADALRAWRASFRGDISIYSYYRKYAWDSLPVVIPRYMQHDLRWYATLPTQGVSVYCEPGDWFTYELNHYVLPALAWDADADVDALVEKFCAARYGSEAADAGAGAAAAAAKSALDAMERIVRVYGSVPHVPLKPAAAIAAARSEMERHAAAIAAAAAAASRAKDESVNRSLRRLELMCTYALRDLEIQHLRATNAPRERVVERAKALHAWAKGHADDGVFLIKGHRLTETRMLARYGVAPPRKTTQPAVPE